MKGKQGPEILERAEFTGALGATKFPN